MKSTTIVGAGLVGSLWAIFLSKAGYKVTLVESKGDQRSVDFSSGKSINLALSERGWNALKKVGIDKEIRKIVIPMYGRTIHNLDGEITYQPYGQESQAIYSVSRREINCKLLEAAENTENTTIHFNEKCIEVCVESGKVITENTETGDRKEILSDVIFATDGAFSSVRHKCFQKLDKFKYSQNYIDDGYKEIFLPSNEDGSYKLDKNTLHIWPRGRFMLIALPNLGGTFTCTLFMPHADGENSFDKLKSKSEINAFFKTTFPDFYKLMPNVADAWSEYPLFSLAIIKCYPWSNGKVVLMGDAAHATVPFYGQGMNCGFEDCTVMCDLMNKHNGDWSTIFEEFQASRKPEGDSVQQLSLDNYKVMRDNVGQTEFLLQKRFEHRIAELYPSLYLPLYSQVCFSNIPYSKALKNGLSQEFIINKIISQYDIKKMFEKNEIDDLIHTLYNEKEEIDERK